MKIFSEITLTNVSRALSTFCIWVLSVLVLCWVLHQRVWTQTAVALHNGSSRNSRLYLSGVGEQGCVLQEP